LIIHIYIRICFRIQQKKYENKYGINIIRLYLLRFHPYQQASEVTQAPTVQAPLCENILLVLLRVLSYHVPLVLLYSLAGRLRTLDLASAVPPIDLVEGAHKEENEDEEDVILNQGRTQGGGPGRLI
jgi:hypothetical protein